MHLCEFNVYMYSLLPTTRTFKGNRKKFRLLEVCVIESLSSNQLEISEKPVFIVQYCTVKILITYNCTNLVKIESYFCDYKSDCNITKHSLNRTCVLLVLTSAAVSCQICDKQHRPPLVNVSMHTKSQRGIQNSRFWMPLYKKLFKKTLV